MAATTTSSSVVVAMLLLLSVQLLLLLPKASAKHNITDILSQFPDYSIYNSYLSQTKVSDEINSRETITCLVLSNPVMSTLASNHPLSAIKNALRLLTLLDYYDPAKLHSISHGTVQTTTLLQTTGDYQGNLGFVNITDVRGGKVAFGSTAPGTKLDSTYTKSVKQLPYSISVLEISAPIIFPGLLDANPDAGNITALLEKAGCKTFASLLASSGVLKMFQDAMDKGLTIFAPNDEAFKAGGVPDLTAMTQVDLVTLLEYHAIPEYAPKATLKNAKRRIGTLATSGTSKYELSVVSSGDDVSLETGLDTSRVASTVIDDTPFCILTVDSVLLPLDLFGKAPSPAPGPAATSPSVAPASTAPAPARDGVPAKAPAPIRASTPAPATESSPEMSPAGAPDGAAADDLNNDEGGSTASGTWDHAMLVGIVGVVAFLSTIKI